MTNASGLKSLWFPLGRMLGVLVIAVPSLVPGRARPHTGAAGQLWHYAAYLLVGSFLAHSATRRGGPLSLALYAGLLECAPLFIPGLSAKLIDALVSAIGPHKIHRCSANLTRLRRSRLTQLFRFHILQPDSASSAQAVARLFNAPQEMRVMFETVVEPVLFRLESDQ
jgi:hypothetical protein